MFFKETGLAFMQAIIRFTLLHCGIHKNRIDILLKIACPPSWMALKMADNGGILKIMVRGPDIPTGICPW